MDEDAVLDVPQAKSPRGEGGWSPRMDRPVLVMMLVSLLASVSVVGAVGYAVEPDATSLLCVAVLGGVVCAVSIVTTAIMRQTHEGIVLIVTTTAVAGILTVDRFALMTGTTAVWPLIYAIYSIVALLEEPASQLCRVGMATVTMLWIVISAGESLLHFGLLDADIQQHHIGTCGTAIPGAATGSPCKTHWALAVVGALLSLIGMLMFFVLGIAKSRPPPSRVEFLGAGGERMVPVRVVAEVLEEIAKRVAQFDLIGADQHLTDAGLPPEICDVLDDFLDWITCCRAYIPASCIPCTPCPEEEETGVDNDDDSSSSDSGQPASWKAAPSSKAAAPKTSALIQEASVVLETEKSFFSVGPTRGPRWSVLSGMTGKSRVSNESQEDDAGVVMGTPNHPMQKSKITLVVLNIRGSLSMLEEYHSHFEASHSLLVAASVLKFSEVKGVVDNFVGDHLFVSFNVSRTCARHPAMSVQASKGLLGSVPQIKVNLSIVCGKAWCGDLGSHTMRRFVILGRLPSLAVALERIGSMWGVTMVCNRPVQVDAAHLHEIRRVPRLLNLHEKTTAEYSVFEVLQRFKDKEADSAAGTHSVRSSSSPLGASQPKSARFTDIADLPHQHEEWMYTMDSGQSYKWEISDTVFAYSGRNPDTMAKYGDTLGQAEPEVQEFVQNYLANPKDKTEFYVY